MPGSVKHETLMRACMSGIIVINSPVGKDSVHDDSYLRKAAIKAKAAYITTVAAAKVTAEGIHYLKTHNSSEVKSLQELHSEIHEKKSLPGQRREL